jgi:hypothetical protein
MARPQGFPLTAEQRLDRLEREVVRLTALLRYVGVELGNAPAPQGRCSFCKAIVSNATHEEVLAHIGECEQHPIRGVEAERDQLRAEIARLTMREREVIRKLTKHSEREPTSDHPQSTFDAHNLTKNLREVLADLGTVAPAAEPQTISTAVVEHVEPERRCVCGHYEQEHDDERDPHKQFGCLTCACLKFEHDPAALIEF